MADDFFQSPEFQELINEYLAYLIGELGKAKQALTSGEYKFVQKFGHNLKGTGKGYGFDDLSQIGAEIETSAQQENAETLPPLLERLEQLLAQHQAERS